MIRLRIDFAELQDGRNSQSETIHEIISYAQTIIHGCDSMQLLVSVRNRDEAIAALHGGADLIDVKEPSRGALGSADRETWAGIVAAVRNRCPVSVACGELSQHEDGHTAPYPDGIAYAKLGLAGMRHETQWVSRWTRWRKSLSDSIQPVMVAYADWQSCDGPSPQEILAVGIDNGSSVMLIDTYFKDGSTLFDRMARRELQEIASSAHRHNVSLALAGSLRRELFDEAAEFRPKIIAVRGAACEGRRDDAVSESRVRLLSDALKHRSTQARPKRSVQGAATGSMRKSFETRITN